MSIHPDPSVTMPPKPPRLSMKSLYTLYAELRQENRQLAARIEQLERQLAVGLAAPSAEGEETAACRLAEPDPQSSADLTRERLPGEIISLVAAINGASLPAAKGKDGPAASGPIASPPLAFRRNSPADQPAVQDAAPSGNRDADELASLVAAVSEAASAADREQPADTPFEAAFEAAYGPEAIVLPVPGAEPADVPDMDAPSSEASEADTGSTSLAVVPEVPVFVSRSSRHPKKKTGLWHRWFGWLSKQSHHRAGHAS